MFKWKKEFELGITSIDNQHKELLNIGNKIYDLLMARSEDELDIDDFDEILEVINDLKDYTKYHFKTEEDLFAKYSYPNADKHIQEHMDFIDYLDSINFDKVDSKQTEFLKELLNKVLNWIFKHIISTDYMYKDFLISKGMN